MRKIAITELSVLVPLFFVVCAIGLRPAMVKARDAEKEKICWQQTASRYKSLSPQAMDAGLDIAIDEYNILVEKSLTYRTNAIVLSKRLKSIVDDGRPIPGRDLDELNQGMLHVMHLREELFDVAYSHACWTGASGELFDKAGIFSMPQELQLKGVMLSLSASLLLYDNYLLMLSIFEEDKKLRRFLNHQDLGYAIDRNELKKATKNYISHKNRKFVKNAISFYESEKKMVAPSFFAEKTIAYLEQLIEQSPSYSRIKQAPKFFLTGEDIQFMYSATGDHLYHFSENSLDLVSKFFGNSVGLVAVRKGHLFADSKVYQQVKTTLQPGDILLEKTPFRLTDKLIPGHWGHVAIWVGTAGELDKLGLWDHPLVKPYQHEIRAGHSVIEALRTGVELNRLDEFLNVDDLAVVRKNDFTDAIARERLLLAFRQIGKGYDFNFDVETTNKIVCSELVYTVYLDMDWPTENAMGRYTISPDHVASKTLNNGPLQLILLYHDGKLVKEDTQGLMEQLL